MCFFRRGNWVPVNTPKTFFRFFDKFHAQMIGNLFSDSFNSNIVRDSRKKLCKCVFFGEETGSQLTLQKLFSVFFDKSHTQLIWNLFFWSFQLKKVRKSRKKFVNVFFRRGNWVPVKTPKTFFRFFDKFYAQLNGNLFFLIILAQK